MSRWPSPRLILLFLLVLATVHAKPSLRRKAPSSHATASTRAPRHPGDSPVGTTTSFQCPGAHSAQELGTVAYNHFGAGKHEAAITCLREALELDPNVRPHTRLHRVNLGKIYQQLGQTEMALLEFERVAKEHPDDTLPLLSMGLIYKGMAKYRKAVRAFEAAIRIDPSLSEPWFHLALCARRAGDPERAEAAYLRAIELQPDFANAHFNLGRIYHDWKRHGEATHHFQQAVKHQPDFALAHNSLGISYQHANRLYEAIHAYKRAVEIQPDLGDAYVNLGNVYTTLGQRDEAIRQFRLAVKHSPGSKDAHYSLGRALKSRMDMNEAAQHFKTALDLSGWDNNAPAFTAYVHSLHFLCDWQQVDKHMPKLHALIQDQLDKQSPTPAVTPFQAFTYNLSLPVFRSLAALMAKNSLDAAQARGGPPSQPPARTHKQWVQWATEHRNRGEEDGDGDDEEDEDERHDRLRVAYVSSDIKNHPLARLMRSVWSHHNRSRVMALMYATTPDDGSQERKVIASSVDRFIDITEVSDQEAVRRMRSQNVHIAVNLNGWTKGERNQLFAMQASPITMSYMGFCGTMGDSRINDYLITDAVASPVEFVAHYADKLVYMPHSYFVNDYRNQQADVTNTPDTRLLHRKANHLPVDNATFVFGNFNQLYKINARTFDAWMNILRAVPRSILWLLRFPRDAQSHILHQAGLRNISADRIVFGEHLAHHPHVQRIVAADLILDTPLCNGHTSTVDALWAGTPMVTMPGQQMAQRVAAGMARAVHAYNDMVVTSWQQYEQRAIHLATHPAELQALRTKLARARSNQPLFDTAAWVAHLETAMTLAWELYIARDAKWHVIVTP